MSTPPPDEFPALPMDDDEEGALDEQQLRQEMEQADAEAAAATTSGGGGGGMVAVRSHVPPSAFASDDGDDDALVLALEQAEQLSQQSHRPQPPQPPPTQQQPPPPPPTDIPSRASSIASNAPPRTQTSQRRFQAPTLPAALPSATRPPPSLLHALQTQAQSRPTSNSWNNRPYVSQTNGVQGSGQQSTPSPSHQTSPQQPQQPPPPPPSSMPPPRPSFPPSAQSRVVHQPHLGPPASPASAAAMATSSNGNIAVAAPSYASRPPPMPAPYPPQQPHSLPPSFPTNNYPPPPSSPSSTMRNHFDTSLQPGGGPSASSASVTTSSSRSSLLLSVDASSLLSLFALYFPSDWPVGVSSAALGTRSFTESELAARRQVQSSIKFQIVERLSRFFHTYRDRYIVESDVLHYGRVVLDYPSFCLHIDHEIKEFEKEMNKNPALLMACLQCALHHTCVSPPMQREGMPAAPFHTIEPPLPHLLVRFRNFQPVSNIKTALKANKLGSFLCVRGTVVRTSQSRPAVKSMQFTCGRCGRRQTQEFTDHLYSTPIACEPPCHSKVFEPDRLSAVCEDWQVIKLQEIVQNIVYTGAPPSSSPPPGGDGRDTPLSSSLRSSSPDAAQLSASASAAALGSLNDAGRVPRHLEVHLIGADLVDAVIPGDIVTVCGFIKSRRQDTGMRGRNVSVFVLYMEANAISKMQGDDNVSDDALTSTAQQMKAEGERGGSDALSIPKSPSSLSTSSLGSLINFSPLELQAILSFVSQCRNPWKTLVASLCPTIFGNEGVKAGLLLALLGGVTKHARGGGGNTSASSSSSPSSASSSSASSQSTSSEGLLNVRGDIHVLVVGDPGLGKSQLLRAASKASPRGVYISGGVTTKTGLTVTMVREGKDGDFALEAGALVLADQGVCCIDEFDKMAAEHSALLEAMEQQSISIAKAGIVCSLAARTSVIAAANPVGGHYNRAKTLSENLKLSAPLLSRFDLVFVKLDAPDGERDQRLSEHIVAMHGAKSRRAAARNGGFSVGGRGRHRDEDLPPFPLSLATHNDIDLSQSSAIASSPSLSHQLRIVPGDPEVDWRSPTEPDLLPVAALRKYIAYARRYCRPLLSSAARKVLADFFLSLRSSAALSPADSAPVTTRQLEALIRLSEARAKVDLQEVVTERHAREVVQLMRESMEDLVSQDDMAAREDMAALGGMGAQVGGGKGRGGKAALKKQFITLLRRKAEVKSEPIFTGSELYELHEYAGLRNKIDDFDAFIDALNADNFLLKVGAKKYKLVPGLI